MTILSNQDIIDRLGDSVIIEPFNPKNVNTSSYDVTLGEFYYIEHKPKWWQRLLFWRRHVYNIWDEEHVHRIWGAVQEAKPAYQVLSGGKYQYTAPGVMVVHGWPWEGIEPFNDRVILLPPKHTILAHTQEFIGGRAGDLRSIDTEDLTDLPSTTMMKARSSFGRNFIEVCKCAGYGDVGYTNRWTMEITNNSRYYHIPLVVGRRIAQIVFMETGPLAGIEDYTNSGKYQSARDVRHLEMEWSPTVMLPKLYLDRDIRRG